jgi:ribosomal protein L37AE/L43A
MNCPKCQGRTKVRKVFYTVRIRVCESCKHQFKTEEVLKHDG